MSENKLSDIIGTSLGKIKELVDANTIIGEPISTPNGTVIIPVSKVSVGFASGGLDYFGKNKPQDKENTPTNFGGGGGTGVTVSPIGFLIIKQDGAVDLLNIASPTEPVRPADTVESIISFVEKSPELIAKFKKLFSKEEKTDAE